MQPGRVAQWVGHLTLVSPSAFSRRAVVSNWRKYVHKVLVNRLGGQSLPRKSVVRLTDRPDMTLDVYRGRKTTIQQQQLISAALISMKHFVLVLGFRQGWSCILYHGSTACLKRLSIVVVWLFYVHGKQLRSCRDGLLT